MRKAILFVMAVGLFAAPSMAETMAPVDVNGEATFLQDGDNWTITTATNRTSISWSRFDVAEGAHVHFQQPNSGSSVMNRVVGGQMSEIHGLLSSNGSVYLANPNGIVIGPTGIISVASFIGTTLSVTDVEFMAGGDMNFTGTSRAPIENYGTIEAIGGDIYLIAGSVVNAGALAAPEGSVNLIAATDVLLTQDQNIFIRPSLPADEAGVGLENSGTIEAIVARLAADGNMYALAINNTGVIRATGSTVADGRVILRAEGGSLSNTGSLIARTVQADGQTVGGEIQVLADDIAVTGDARIDASGDLGGGRVLIGGDYQGANPSIPNAATTLIGSDAAVAADALLAGDGGTVIVWSDDATTVAGSISAQGAAGGNGGFVETSGGTLELDGLTLACGFGGTWLLDPPILTIDAALAAAIVAQLNANTNVIQAGDGVIVEADIIATPTASPYLRLNSTDFIAINADINVGSGKLYLVAAGGVTQAGGTTLTADKLWLSGNGAFYLNQPGNDFGTISFAVNGVGNIVSIQDVNDIVIGTVRGVSGISVMGGEVHIVTPNGHILANGLFPAGIVTGYHALGNVSLTETSFQSGAYEIRISNELPYSKTPAEIEAFLLAPGALMAFNPDTNVGSAVRIEFGDLAGDSLGYSWNFRVAETFDPSSANDYSMMMTQPTPGAPEMLSDLETARNSAMQDSGEFSWQTGWADETQTLNHVDPYTLSFASMNVDHPQFVSKLYLRNILFTGHQCQPQPVHFVYNRIFDYVEDFPHIRPDQRVSLGGAEGLMPVLDEVSTYFDESAQATDPRYFYQSVGSIYQIPR